MSDDMKTMNNIKPHEDEHHRLVEVAGAITQLNSDMSELPMTVSTRLHSHEHVNQLLDMYHEEVEFLIAALEIEYPELRDEVNLT